MGVQFATIKQRVSLQGGLGTVGTSVLTAQGLLSSGLADQSEGLCFYVRFARPSGL